jgi:heptosyltransferase-2
MLRTGRRRESEDRECEGGLLIPDDVKLALLRPYIWKVRWLLRCADFLSRSCLFLTKKKSPGRTQNIENILVVAPGNLGDGVMLVPFLQNVRRTFPDARVVVVSGKAIGDFVRHQGLIDEWVPTEVPWTRRSSRFSKNNLLSVAWLRFAKTLIFLRKQEFDLAFCVGGWDDLRVYFAVALAGARRVVGRAGMGGEHFLTDVVPRNLQRLHMVDSSLSLLEPFGVKPCVEVPFVRVSPAEQERAREILKGLGVQEKEKLVVGVHPGAGSPVRAWGEDRFAKVSRYLVEQYGARVLWFSDPAESRPAPPESLATTVRLPLLDFVAVVSCCQLLVCNDSGPMHVAAGLGVPVVAVFGPNRPEFVGPYGEGHQVVIRQEFWCRPCGDVCRWKEPYCLRLIQVEDVTRAVDAAMQRILKQTAPHEGTAQNAELEGEPAS